MVISEYKKVERYIWGLTKESQGKATASKLTKIQEAIRIKLNEYVGTLPLCDKYKLHHHGPFPVQCANCKKFGHQARDCWTPTSLTCYECGEEGHIRKYCPDLENQNGIKEAYQDSNIFMASGVATRTLAEFDVATHSASSCPRHHTVSARRTTESNDVRRTTIRRPHQELVADVEVANNLLHELNQYLEQLCSHALELLRVEALPAHPLIKYIFNALERASFVDMTNSSNLVAVMTDLLRFIADKKEMINHYRTITYVVFGMM
nr:hypothetical protein [Tanacetum cinerariifolium]